jgi:hypothetical protein
MKMESVKVLCVLLCVVALATVAEGCTSLKALRKCLKDCERDPSGTPKGISRGDNVKVCKSWCHHVIGIF